MEPAPGPQGAPRTTGAVPAAAWATSTDGFRQHLGGRPPLSVPGVLAAVGGGLLAAAAYGVMTVSDDPSPWLAVGIGIVMVVLGWAAAAALGLAELRSPQVRPTQLVPGATVVAVVGVYLAVVGIAVEVTQGSGSVPSATAWWPAVLATGVLILLWVAPGLQGRPAVLAATLVTATYSLAAAVGVAVGFDQPRSAAGGVIGPDSFAEAFNPFGAFGPFGSDGVRAAGGAAMVVGCGLLVLAAAADRVRLPGLGTPLLVAGTITGLIGSLLMAPDNDLVRAVAPVVVVALLGAAGALGGRKGSVWLAAVLAVPLVVQLCVALLGDDPGAGLVVLLLVLVGALFCIAAGAALTLGRRRDDTAGQVPPPPPPPPPSPASAGGPPSYPPPAPRPY